MNTTTKSNKDFKAISLTQACEMVYGKIQEDMIIGKKDTNWIIEMEKRKEQGS